MLKEEGSGAPLGLLSQNPNGSYFLLIGDQKATFANKKELADVLGVDLFDRQIEEEKQQEIQNYINGFPVTYNEIYPFYNHPSGLPTFTKSENSDTLYCAGYYCLKRDHGWAKIYCSKLDTLQKYKFEGPFKTVSECRDRLSALKKQEKRKARNKS